MSWAIPQLSTCHCWWMIVFEVDNNGEWLGQNLIISTIHMDHSLLDIVWHEMDEELYLSVPSKRNGLWGTIVRRERRVRSGMWRVFNPSINTPPLLIGVSRNRQLKMLDFPAPVRPAIPTYFPKSFIRMPACVNLVVFKYWNNEKYV